MCPCTKKNKNKSLSELHIDLGVLYFHLLHQRSWKPSLQVTKGKDEELKVQARIWQQRIKGHPY